MLVSYGAMENRKFTCLVHHSLTYHIIRREPACTVNPNRSRCCIPSVNLGESGWRDFLLFILYLTFEEDLALHSIVLEHFNKDTIGVP